MQEESNVAVISQEAEQNEEIKQQILEVSGEYFTEWEKLVSVTNWEKGKIILQWRAALVEEGLPVSEYSDQVWAEQVRNITPQHVGRLRRVAERFGEIYESYEGLYWSHFQAALDWEDAEMWLEGAVQNAWSISQMRNNHWEANDAPADKKPNPDDIITGVLDEDVEPGLEGSLGEENQTIHGSNLSGEEMIDSDRALSAASGGEASGASETTVSSSSVTEYDEEDDVPFDPTLESTAPFESLPEFPADLEDALEKMKLAIIAHRLNNWEDVSPEDVLAALNALKHLTLARGE